MLLLKVHIPPVPRGGPGQGWHSQAQCLLAGAHHSPAVECQETCKWHHRSKLHCGWETPQLGRFCTIDTERLIFTGMGLFLISATVRILQIL